jgi:hypothetical protein
VQVDERGALAVVAHPGHEFLEIRARVGGDLVPSVPQVVKVDALQADGGQGRKPDPIAEIRAVTKLHFVSRLAGCATRSLWAARRALNTGSITG